MKKLSIAIDGPAASGKSTIAKKIAEKYNYIYIDTGAMYRCVAYYTYQHHIDPTSKDEIIQRLSDMTIELKSDHTVYLNGEDVTLAIRQNEISILASKVSQYPEVRSYLVDLQRQMAACGGVVLDGRDIGTVVLPNADLKLYQVASVDARAMRRHKENIEKGLQSDIDQIKKDIEQRDYEDMHRAASPLRQAEDAILIDTSDLTIDEVLEKVDELMKGVGVC